MESEKKHIAQGWLYSIFHLVGMRQSKRLGSVKSSLLTGYRTVRTSTGGGARRCRTCCAAQLLSRSSSSCSPINCRKSHTMWHVSTTALQCIWRRQNKKWLGHKFTYGAVLNSSKSFFCVSSQVWAKYALFGMFFRQFACMHFQENFPCNFMFFSGCVLAYGILAKCT